MCGITGFLETRAALDPLTITRMTRQLLHRGPDDEGLFCDPEAGVALGHRRLAILDLSPLGHQPMFSASGRYVIGFNGEVYNFEGLRRELQGSAEFRGTSDTEVVLAAFERWGVEAALQRFNGMFAFALWDRRERRLTLARDRLGEKPLYYGWAGSTFLFGSELKALRVHPHFRGEIDRGALSLYFRYNYVPGVKSIYRDIHQLTPGGYLEIDGRRAGAAPQVRLYWSAPAAMEAGRADVFLGSEEEAVEALDTRLRRTVRSRMIADVPLGAFLSGGIDSSLVVALMQRESGRRIKTFTMAFEHPEYNEAHHARSVAGYLQTDHTEMCVTPGEALGVIPGLASVFDEPFGDASQIPTLLMCGMARRMVTVALSGDGGDELFGGYSRYAWHDQLRRMMERMPDAARAWAGDALNRLPVEACEAVLRLFHPLTPRKLRLRNPGENLHRLRRMLRTRNPLLIYRDLVSIWPDPAAVVYGGLDADPLLANDHPDFDSIHRLMLLDTINYLPGDILVKLDRASMSVGLETRAPLLDHKVFELAARLPLSMKVRDRQGKWILRRLLDRYVPRDLVKRPKAGFAVPLDDWLRNGLRPWAEEMLSLRRLRSDGYLNPQAVREKWTEHLSGKRNWMYPLWGALMFEAWLAEHHGAPPATEQDGAPAMPVGSGAAGS